MTIPIGTKVRIKIGAVKSNRVDPYRHEIERHVGETQLPARGHTTLVGPYVIVRFEGCPSYHRFVEDELEIVSETEPRGKRTRT